MTNQKKFIYLTLLLLLVLGLVLANKVYFKKTNTTTQNNQTNEIKLEEKVILEDPYPPGITLDLLFEPGATVISKSTQTTNTGVRSTYIYESKLTQKAAAEGYDKFLKSLGWATTLVENKQAKIFTINATKDTTKAYIIVDQNDITKKVTVDVTVQQTLTSSAPVN